MYMKNILLNYFVIIAVQYCLVCLKGKKIKTKSRRNFVKKKFNGKTFTFIITDTTKKGDQTQMTRRFFL